MLTVQHLHRHYETVIQGITLDFVRARKEADDCVKQFEQEAQLVSDRNENAIKELYAIIKNQQQLMESMREDLHLAQTTSAAYKDLVVKQESVVNEVERLHDILATKTLELKQVSFDYWNLLAIQPLEWEAPLRSVLSFSPHEGNIDYLLTKRFRLDSLFNLIQPLGNGAVGTVTLQQNILSQEFVAVKTVRLRKYCSSSLKRTSNEMSVLYYSSHPNILQALEFFQVANKIQMVLPRMEFSFFNILSMPVAIPLPVATAFIKDLFTGLEYIHDILGMCHRDIKPGNALVSVSKAILVISDFDTADFCPPTNPTTSGFFDFCGTVGYMAPEVAAFDPNFETPETSSYGTSCDIFSAGSMVREICGKIPEETDAAEGHAEIELRVMGMECCAYHPQQRPTAQSVLM
ncbi:hypothetical protein HDU99_003046, partial [Rhizoclosmatium hyalinum]